MTGVEFRAIPATGPADLREAHHPAGVRALGQGFDRAVALFQEALPEFGLKLVVPPPSENGRDGRVSVSAWRRGETRARLHAAAHASDALLALIRCETDEDRGMQRRRDCRHCRGLGWTIMAGGAKAVCPHPK